jgi:hypothetical protein
MGARKLGFWLGPSSQERSDARFLAGGFCRIYDNAGEKLQSDGEAADQTAPQFSRLASMVPAMASSQGTLGDLGL